MELPDRSEYPDYYLTIKNPIAFDIIRSRLENGAYSSENMVNFGKDLRTLTANAKEYNRKGSPIHKDATTLEVSPHAPTHTPTHTPMHTHPTHHKKTDLSWTPPTFLASFQPLFFSRAYVPRRAFLCVFASLRRELRGLMY
ncbi:MAG: Bromodomain-containing protein [Podila humilis]|nr:MAG: Bromodomain-containing protein [Podila humilis]